MDRTEIGVTCRDDGKGMGSIRKVCPHTAVDLLIKQGSTGVKPKS